MQTHQIISREAAFKAHLKTYFTGTPCRNGHTAPRYVSTGGCLKCLNKYQGSEGTNPFSEHLEAYSDQFWKDKRLPFDALPGLKEHVQRAIDAYCDDFITKAGLTVPTRTAIEVVASAGAEHRLRTSWTPSNYAPPAVEPKPKRPPVPKMQTTNVEFAAKWVFGKQYMSNEVLEDDAGAEHRLWWPVDRHPVEELFVKDSGGPDAKTHQVLTDDVARLCVYPWVLRDGQWFVCEDVNYGLWPVIREEHASLVLMKFNEEGRGF